MFTKIVEACGDLFGLGLKVFRSKSVEIAKIIASVYYLDGVRAARRYALQFCMIVFLAVFLAVAFVVMPVAVLVVWPLASTTKLWILAGLAVVDIALPIWGISVFFSEERWIRLSGLEAIIRNLSHKK